MLGKLFSSFKRSTTHAEAVVAPPAQEAVATQPVVTDEPSPLDRGQSLGFVTHQPVFDRQRHIVAYTFAAKRGTVINDDQLRGFDRLLLSTLRNMNVFRLLNYRRAFIHVSLVSLDSLQEAALPLESCVFVLEPGASPSLDDHLVQKLDSLKTNGMRFACEPARFGSQAGALQFYQRMDYLLLDLARPGAAHLLPLIEKLPQRIPKLRWMITNINTVEELDACERLPGQESIVLLHGSYPIATSHGKQTGRETSPSQLRLLEIMRLLRANADVSALEAQFKLDSLLLFKLLRYINSPINGLNKTVQTIEECILLLGRENLLKWVSLMMFTSVPDNQHAMILMEKSLVRGRFMEQLGQQAGNRLQSEHLFLTGMFSMLGALLNTTLPQALLPLDLPDMVRQALLESTGLFAEPLQLTLASEREDEQQITALCQKLGISVDQANELFMEALVWAQEVLNECDAQHGVANV